MRSYQTARGLHGLLEFVFWGAFVVGILIAIGAGQAASRSFGGSGVVAILPGLLLSFISLLGVAQVQNARAAVDSAEYGQQMLDVARRQLEVSQLMLRSQDRSMQSFAQLVQPTESKNDGPTSSAGNKTAPMISYANIDDTKKADVTEQAKAMGNDPDVVDGKKNGTVNFNGNTIKVISGLYNVEGFSYSNLATAVEKLQAEKRRSDASPGLGSPLEMLDRPHRPRS